MKIQPRYRLTSDSGEYIVGAMIIAGLLMALLREQLWLVILSPVMVIGILLFVLLRQKVLLLFEEGFMLRDSRAGNKNEIVPYAQMKKAEFQLSSGKGANRLRIVFQSGREMDFYFKAWMPRRELEFLKEKGVEVKLPVQS